MSSTVSGQSLLDDLRANLGGLSNAFTVEILMGFVNDGLQEVWSLLRSLDLDYTTDSSQTAIPTDDNFLQTLTTSQREYDLPKNLREIRMIECTTPGFEVLEFELRAVNNQEFQEVRRQATANGAGSGSNTGIYHYAVVGKQFLFAEYPEAALSLKVWYVRAINGIDVNDSLTDIIIPFSRKIIDYAAMKATLSARNEVISDAWSQVWKNSVKTIAITAGPRASATPVFIADFLG